MYVYLTLLEVFLNLAHAEMIYHSYFKYTCVQRQVAIADRLLLDGV